MTRQTRRMAIVDAIWGGLLALALAFSSSCTQAYTAKTKASWTTPNGVTINYESDKEEIGLVADFDVNTGKAHVSVDKASTSEAAIQAAIAQSQAWAAIFQALLPIIAKAAAAGAAAP